MSKSFIIHTLFAVILIVLISTFADFSKYFIERKPDEWKELDFLKWLNENDYKLIHTNLPIQERESGMVYLRNH